MELIVSLLLLSIFWSIYIMNVVALPVVVAQEAIAGHRITPLEADLLLSYFLRKNAHKFERIAYRCALQ